MKIVTTNIIIFIIILLLLLRIPYNEHEKYINRVCSVNINLHQLQ